jgi:hypothetical protein
VAKQLRATLMHVFQRSAVPPQPDVAVASEDVFAIVKCMVDAGERGELDRQKFQEQVSRAAFWQSQLLPAGPVTADPWRWRCRPAGRPADPRGARTAAGYCRGHRPQKLPVFGIVSREGAWTISQPAS